MPLESCCTAVKRQMDYVDVMGKMFLAEVDPII